MTDQESCPFAQDKKQFHYVTLQNYAFFNEYDEMNEMNIIFCDSFVDGLHTVFILLIFQVVIGDLSYHHIRLLRTVGFK